MADNGRPLSCNLRISSSSWRGADAIERSNLTSLRGGSRTSRSRANALPQPAELLAQLLAGEFTLQIPDLVEVRRGTQPLQPLPFARADVRHRPGCRLLLSRQVNLRIGIGL